MQEDLIVSSKQNRFDLRREKFWWIDDMRFSLADICAQGEFDDFGLFRFLNRVSFLSTEHLVFAIIKPLAENAERDDAKPKRYEHVIHSAMDPIYYEHFCEQVVASELGFMTTEGRLIFHSKLAEDHCVSMLGTKYAILAFHLNVNSTGPGKQPELLFELIPTTKNGIWDCLNYIFKAFDGVNGRIRLMEPSLLEEKLDSLVEKAAVLEASHDDPARIEKYELAWIQQFEQTFLGLIDREYQRLALSPLLDSFYGAGTEFPKNIFFFKKSFTRDTGRYQNLYRYEPILVLATAQKDALADRMAKSDRSHFIPFGIDKVDNEYWSLIKKGGGINQVFDELCKPLPSCIRLFIENALISGTTTTKPDIFRHGGVGWIDETIPLSVSERSYAEKRLVYLHYLLQLAAPVKPTDTLGNKRSSGAQQKDHSLSLIAIPYRCSGANWMCAVSIRENLQGEIVHILKERELEKLFLYYHSLLRNSERRLRSRAKRLFLEQIGSIVGARMAADQGRSVALSSSSITISNQGIEMINHAIQNLCRIYPFEQLVFSTNPGTNRAELSDIDISPISNPYFTRLTLHSFLEEDGFANKIFAQAIAYLSIHHGKK